eukprot:gene10891-9912_t
MSKVGRMADADMSTMTVQSWVEVFKSWPTDKQDVGLKELVKTIDVNGYVGLDRIKALQAVISNVGALLQRDFLAQLPGEVSGGVESEPHERLVCTAVSKRWREIVEAGPSWQRTLDTIEDEEALCDLESPVNNRYFYEIRRRVCQMRGISADDEAEVGNISAVDIYRAWNMLKGFWKRGALPVLQNQPTHTR